MKVRIKVRCSYKSDHHLGMYPSPDQSGFIGNDPQGEIQLDNLRPEVMEAFVGGSEYIVTFEQVPVK